MTPKLPATLPSIEGNPMTINIPDTGPGINRKFQLQNCEMYALLRVHNGRVVRVECPGSHNGSTLRGFVTHWCDAASYALSLGGTVAGLRKFASTITYSPSGQTQSPDITQADSIIDYLLTLMEKVERGEVRP